MSATPAGTLLAPTPRLRTTVGKSSAVNTGTTALLDETENLPIMTKTIVARYPAPLLALEVDIKRVSRQATPPMTKVRHRGHRRPIFSRIPMLIAIAGISTAPGNKRFY